MLANPPNRHYKLIKIYKIGPNNVQQKLQQINQKLTSWMKWSKIQKVQLQQNFLIFANQSIYKQAIRVTHYGQKQLYYGELIKCKWPTGNINAFNYQYQPTIFYDNPVPLFKQLGYNNYPRKSKNVKIFTNLKYGLQINLYEYKQRQTFQVVNDDVIYYGKLQVIQTGCYAFTQFLFKDLEVLLKDLYMEPLAGEMEHYFMTLKGLEYLENQF